MNVTLNIFCAIDSYDAINLKNFDQCERPIKQLFDNFGEFVLGPLLDGPLYKLGRAVTNIGHIPKMFDRFFPYFMSFSRVLDNSDYKIRKA